MGWPGRAQRLICWTEAGRREARLKEHAMRTSQKTAGIITTIGSWREDLDFRSRTRNRAAGEATSPVARSALRSTLMLAGARHERPHRGRARLARKAHREPNPLRPHRRTKDHRSHPS